jgi:hypothetical protein
MSLMIGISYPQHKLEVILSNNKIQERWVEIIPIINSPLGPLLDTLFSCGKTHPPSLSIFSAASITFIYLKKEKYIHILNCLAIATFICALCINQTEDYSGDVTRCDNCQHMGRLVQADKMSLKPKMVL